MNGIKFYKWNDVEYSVIAELIVAYVHSYNKIFTSGDWIIGKIENYDDADEFVAVNTANGTVIAGLSDEYNQDYSKANNVDELRLLGCFAYQLYTTGLHMSDATELDNIDAVTEIAGWNYTTVVAGDPVFDNSSESSADRRTPHTEHQVAEALSLTIPESPAISEAELGELFREDLERLFGDDANHQLARTYANLSVFESRPAVVELFADWLRSLDELNLHTRWNNRLEELRKLC